MMYKLKKKRKKQILNSILLFFCCKKTERIHAVSCDCCIRLMPFLLYSCYLCMYHWCIFNAWWDIASSWFTVLTPAWIIVMLLYGISECFIAMTLWFCLLLCKVRRTFQTVGIDLISVHVENTYRVKDAGMSRATAWFVCRLRSGVLMFALGE